MKARTYRYFTGDPLWGFGFGLSYSKFTYSGLRSARNPAGAAISVRVKNDSSRDGDEVIQLYVGGTGPTVRSLRGFRRIHLRAGESRTVEFTLTPQDLPKEKVRISVGGGQPMGTVARLESTL
jgi:beta-glucosidase